MPKLNTSNMPSNHCNIQLKMKQAKAAPKLTKLLTYITRSKHSQYVNLPLPNRHEPLSSSGKMSEQKPCLRRIFG